MDPKKGQENMFCLYFRLKT